MSAEYASHHGPTWRPGSARAHYGNDQAAGTMWFHDHTLGMTRVNVYAGPSGFYLLRGGAHDLEPGVLPGAAHHGEDSHGATTHEIPIVIQDRAFRKDGSLFYPDSREYFDGSTWPDLNVERRRYRLRLLNGCGSRFLILGVSASSTARPATPAAPLWQVGGDGGFLREPVAIERILLAPSERADVVVDFSHFRAGTHLYLLNQGPDEPFGGGEPGEAFEFADPATTGLVMRFTVVDRVGHDDQRAPRPAHPSRAPVNWCRDPHPRPVDHGGRLRRAARRGPAGRLPRHHGR